LIVHSRYIIKKFHKCIIEIEKPVISYFLISVLVAKITKCGSGYSEVSLLINGCEQVKNQMEKSIFS